MATARSRCWPMLAVLLLGGCTTADLKSLRQAPPPADPFRAVLSRLYLQFAESEAEEYDWVDSQYFAEKGLRTAYGGDVTPESPADWDLPGHQMAASEEMRRQLEERLTEAARRAYPEAAAQAQHGYECWLEQSEEGWQADEIEACREAFQTAMAALGAAEPAKPTAPAAPAAKSKPPARTEKPTAPAAAEKSAAKPVAKPAAKPAAPVKPDAALPQKKPAKPALEALKSAVGAHSYLIYFAPGGREITPSGREVIRKIAENAKTRHRKAVTVNGHSDTAAGAEASMDISQRRGDEVKRALVAAGVPERMISVFAFGSTDLKRKTAAGVVEPVNCRVEVFLE